MQKIIPHLWFDNRAEEAIGFYTSLFGQSKITKISRIPEGPAKGNITGTFKLEGQQFMAIDAGPYFQFSPAISFFVSCRTPEEVDDLWSKLVEGGTVLMPLDTYPFSERFGWLADKFGVSWQLHFGPRAQKIAPFLLFVGEQHGKADEAMHFYTSLFENSGVSNVVRYGAEEGETEGTVKHAVFTLAGQEFMAMDSGLAHAFTFTGAISLLVNCGDQAEIDDLWDKLSDGGEIQQCGWVKDKYGVFWQIVPEILGAMLHDTDAEKSKRVFNAVMGMKKLDIEELARAYEASAPSVAQP